MNIILAEKLAARGYRFTPQQKLKLEEPKPEHIHNWQIYKKHAGINKRMQQFWLIFRGCPDCKEKYAIDMVRELPVDLSKYLAVKSNSSAGAAG